MKKKNARNEIRTFIAILRKIKTSLKLFQTKRNVGMLESLWGSHPSIFPLFHSKNV